MRIFRNFVWFTAAFFITFSFFFSEYAHAYSDPGPTIPASHSAPSANVFPGTGTVTSVLPTATGYSVVSNGFPRVSGLEIPVSTTSKFARAAVGVAGATAAAAMCKGLIGGVICSAAIAYGIDKGIKKCTEFGWCSPAPAPVKQYKWTGPGANYDSISDACVAYAVNAGRPYSQFTFGYSVANGSSFDCWGPDSISGGTFKYGNTMPVGSGTCPPGSNLINNVCVYAVSKPDVASPAPWLDPGFGPYLGNTPGDNPRLVDVGAESTKLGYPPLSETSGPMIDATTKTSSPVVTKTESVPKTDGSVDTKTTTTTTTVTPTVTNNGTPQAKITYQTTTGNVTTTTNNVSNVTTTNTTNDVKPNDQPQLDLPTDYNRESTQQKIADSMDCTLHPYRSDCQEMGDSPEPEKIPNQNVPVTYNPLTFTSAAACPADLNFAMMGKAFSISYSPLCDFMIKMRPIFLAMGAIAAAYIFSEGFKS